MTWFAGQKALVPIDFSEESKTVVDTVLEIGFPANKINIIHVAPDLATMTPGVVWGELTDASRKANVEKNFQSLFSDKKYEGISCEVAFGEAGHAIVDYAEEVGTDLIVMSSHGRTGFKRLMLGSVAERVLRLAHCAVLVLKH